MDSVFSPWLTSQSATQAQTFKECFDLVEELGIIAVALDVNPGEQIPYDRIVNSIR
jgi:hypothetical protein